MLLPFHVPFLCNALFSKDWDHWLEKPATLPMGVVADLAGEHSNAASAESGMHLCVGTKV
jgi:hypothetical protein